jgi:hypothetical protein
VPVFAQSLADLAKKEEERRKRIPEPAKVYTNKDLAPAPPSTPATATPAPDAPGAPAADVPAATSPGDASKDKPAADADKDKDPKKTQAYWSGKMKTLRDEVARNETFAEALQSRLNALQTDFVNRDDPAQRAVIDKNRQKAATELDRLKKTIADGHKAITDFEEEARRAGIPPGWLR